MLSGWRMQQILLHTLVIDQVDPDTILLSNGGSVNIPEGFSGSFNDLTGGDILRCVNTPAEVGAGLCDIDIGIFDLIERANRS